MTNYTHIYVVHMYEHMATKGCLYRYSQQGWEALNKLIRNWFFRRGRVDRGLVGLFAPECGRQQLQYAVAGDPVSSAGIVAPEDVV